MTSDLKVVAAFIRAINQRNLSEISELMTEDHTFVEMGSNQGAGSSAALPIITTAFAIGTSNHAPTLTNTTWNTYQSSYEGMEDVAFETLGAYYLPANGSSRADQTTSASPDDIAAIQRLVNTTNLFTLVLKPLSPGFNIAHSFGDGFTAGSNPAKLVATTAPRLSVSRSGSNLSLSWPPSGWGLQFAPTLHAPVTWTNVDSSTNSNQYLWPASSGSGYFRLTK